MYKFIDALKKQHNIHHFEILQRILGHPGNPRNKKYATIALRIRTIVEDGNRNIIDYLRGIAHNYDF